MDYDEIYICRCTSGVLQGGNLAPLLYISYINDLLQCLRYSQCLMFAEDLNVFNEINVIQDTENLKTDAGVRTTTYP